MGFENTGLLLSVDWNMTLLDEADNAMSLLVMPCTLFMWTFQPNALVDPEYHRALALSAMLGGVAVLLILDILPRKLVFLALPL